jgi:hypothetical protein
MPSLETSIRTKALVVALGKKELGINSNWA